MRAPPPCLRIPLMDLSYKQAQAKQQICVRITIPDPNDSRSGVDLPAPQETPKSSSGFPGVAVFVGTVSAHHFFPRSSIVFRDPQETVILNCTVIAG